jgi:signal peptidase I
MTGRLRWLVLAMMGSAGLGGCGDEAPTASAEGSREVVVIAAENMYPRLKVPERVEFDLAAYEQRKPAVGDIVLIRPPLGARDAKCGSPRHARTDQLCVLPAGGPDPRSARFVTRVVAVGGDRVRFQHGRVVRNGAIERGPVQECDCTYARAITVPAGHVYVAGDNRGSSDDSRYWGAVPDEQVLGRFVRSLGPSGQ